MRSMTRVQSISPRPQFNNFSRDTVPLSCCKSEFIEFRFGCYLCSKTYKQTNQIISFFKKTQNKSVKTLRKCLRYSANNKSPHVYYFLGRIRTCKTLFFICRYSILFQSFKISVLGVWNMSMQKTILWCQKHLHHHLSPGFSHTFLPL